MLELYDKRYNDIHIVFKEDGHTYTDTLGNTYKSATTLLHDYQPKFDNNFWLKKKAKELNISEKKLQKQWDAIKDEACKRGTDTHNGLETGIKESSMFSDAIKYMIRDNGTMITVADIPNINLNIREMSLEEFKHITEGKYPKFYDLFAFYINKGYKIYAEIGVFLIDYLISGTIDVLLIREDKFVIGDWKTNRGGLKFEAGYYKKDRTVTPIQETDVWITTKDKLLPPLQYLPSCNGSIYNLQLSLYAWMVEHILHIPCAGLWLGHIDSDFILNQYGRPKRFSDGLYHIKPNPEPKCTLYKMTYLKEEISKILYDRYREIEYKRISSKSLFDE